MYSELLSQMVQRHVAFRTARRVRGLRVEARPGLVVLRGCARSYLDRELAQHGVRDLLPDVPVQNVILVGRAA